MKVTVVLPQANNFLSVSADAVSKMKIWQRQDVSKTGTSKFHKLCVDGHLGSIMNTCMSK